MASTLPNSLPVFLVDAFTETAFRGNPAAVCPFDGNPALSDAEMQAIAMEMNQAETAFVQPHGNGFMLRWFTPTLEVDLCGHATLAAAHILWETGRADPASLLSFETRSGILTAVRQPEGITLDFPAELPLPCDACPVLLEGLGTTPVAVLQNRMDYFVELADETAVRSLRPNLSLWETLPVRGIIVTSRADATKDYDFVSRFFAPASGVPEDPVTGSAHCALAPYWQARLGKNLLVGYQASKRGGYVRVEVRGQRVLLQGQAVTVLLGTLKRG